MFVFDGIRKKVIQLYERSSKKLKTHIVTAKKICHTLIPHSSKYNIVLSEFILKKVQKNNHLGSSKQLVQHTHGSRKTCYTQECSGLIITVVVTARGTRFLE